MDTRLSKRLAELARENGDRPHVSFHEATYDDTVEVRSPYEGVLLELVDSCDDAGLYVYYDNENNAVRSLGIADAQAPQQVTTEDHFAMIVCTHDDHPNYA